MSSNNDAIKRFTKALGSADADELGLHLAPSVEWIVEGLPTLHGRESILRYWRRLLLRYRAIRVSLNRLVIDGDTRIAEQTHMLDRGEAGSLLFANIAVYRLQDGRICHWTDHIDLSDAPPAEVALWRRLRELA
ncbi:nuclear transport factor 2 family protein [Brevundimonas variabilis]|uniref:Limonene-1,2-epoxide hydrolase n=1 Tax=Brevundimonas variabilis TaxID=74312 RepID=A0A7W9CJF5_9CAUL|nr:nuclear transport factor 2 family protein [Brevundimonas variabilis]MBB5746584.1 limonene-1,2-epoxide hydrolase [Brevundimonas variabilis]